MCGYVRFRIPIVYFWFKGYNISFLIFISIFFLVRSLAAVISTFAVIFLTIGSSFGSIGLMGNALNQMVITFPILIITLALADCIHLFSIYFQQRTQGKTSEESMRRSLELNLQPLFLTTVTTCIGFLSFNSNIFKIHTISFDKLYMGFAVNKINLNLSEYLITISI